MSVFQAVVLGIVQGLTEFLPISSSAHLIIVPWLLDWEEPGLAFDAALHLGTLAAVIAYFWRDLLDMLLAIPNALRRPSAYLRNTDGSLSERDRSARLAWLIAIGCIPGGVVGLLAQDRIDDFFHGDDHTDLALALIAIALVAFGLLLWAADNYARHRRGISDLGVKDTIVIGGAQALALFPGVSRSGVTLTAGLFREIRRADAARFSFLLGTPLVLLASGKGLYDLVTDGAGDIGNVQLIAGVLASAISGFAAISFLLRFLQRSSTFVFVVYRVALGLGILFLIATGLR